MKKVLFIMAFLVPILTYAQGYKIDGDNIVVSAIVENIDASKEEIYGRAKAFFTRSYNDANSVVQADDKEGGLLIGKGLYTGLASHSLGAWKLKAYHIIRVDIKDGRARIICSVTTIIPNSNKYTGNDYEYKIVDYSPVTDKRAPGCPKGTQKKALDTLIDRMSASVNTLSEALKGGGLLETEKEDW